MTALPRTMRAIALRPGAPAVELVELPTPEPKPGEVLIRAVRTGICGTDREMILRRMVDVPPGEKFLVLGHEGLGRIVAVNGDAGGFKAGDLVVPLVRRSCGACNACRHGRADLCYTGKYIERGIHWQHGFFSEYYADRPEWLVPVAPEDAELAVLAEPTSVAVKALELALRLQERVRFDGAYSAPGAREKVLIAGHGPIGTLGALLFRTLEFEVSVAGRRARDDPQARAFNELGIGYLNSQGEELARAGPFFIIFEATGLSPLAFELTRYLGRNGGLILTGVPRGPQSACLDLGRVMAGIVRTNQVVAGSVNAAREHFVRGLEFLREFRRRWPRYLAERIFSRRLPLARFREAFDRREAGDVKVLLEFDGEPPGPPK